MLTAMNSSTFIYESAPDLEKIKEFANERYAGKLKQSGKIQQATTKLTKSKRILINGG